jgi:hypothetical protein
MFFWVDSLPRIYIYIYTWFSLANILYPPKNDRVCTFAGQMRYANQLYPIKFI